MASRATTTRRTPRTTVIRQRGEYSRTDHTRSGHASGPRRGTAATLGGEPPPRLLEGHTPPMGGEEHKRLITALAELLADWLAKHPERRPAGLRSARGSGLVDSLGTVIDGIRVDARDHIEPTYRVPAVPWRVNIGRMIARQAQWPASRSWCEGSWLALAAECPPS
jgi:hypothetical protein